RSRRPGAAGDDAGAAREPGGDRDVGPDGLRQRAGAAASPPPQPSAQRQRRALKQGHQSPGTAGPGLSRAPPLPFAPPPRPAFWGRVPAAGLLEQFFPHSGNTAVTGPLRAVRPADRLKPVFWSRSERPTRSSREAPHAPHAELGRSCSP